MTDRSEKLGTCDMAHKYHPIDNRIPHQRNQQCVNWREQPAPVYESQAAARANLGGDSKTAASDEAGRPLAEQPAPAEPPDGLCSRLCRKVAGTARGGGAGGTGMSRACKAMIAPGIVCGESEAKHTPENAKADVSLDHAFEPATWDAEEEADD